MAFEITDNIKTLKGGSLDALRGSYATLALANTAIPNVIVDGINYRKGKQVDIEVSGVITVYCWQGGYDDANLVPLFVGAGGSDENFTSAFKDKLESITAIFTTALKTAYDISFNWIAINGNNLINHLSRTDNPHNVTKSQVGLSNVDNTSDVDKPLSTASTNALSGKQATLVSGTNIKTINGTEILGVGDIVISGGGGGATNLVLGTRTDTTQPITNDNGTGFTLPTATTSLAGLLSGTLKTAYDAVVTWVTTNGATVLSHLTRTDNPHGVTKTQVGLSDVPNTNFTTAVGNKVDKDGVKVLSDVNFSTAKDAKLTGIATGATANDTDANLKNRTNHTGTQLAITISDFGTTVLATVTTGYAIVTASIGSITDTVQSFLNKLQAQILLKANLASPTFTGTPNLPTGAIGVKQTVGNNTTALATTSFVFDGLALKAPIREDVVTVPTSKTFALTDENKFQDVTADVTITIPLNSVVALPIGSKIKGVVRATKTATFSPATVGVTLIADSLTATGLKEFECKKVSTDTWILTTSGGSAGGGVSNVTVYNTTANSAAVTALRYKEVTVSGASVGDAINVSDCYRVFDTEVHRYLISGKVTSANTVTLYFTAFRWFPNGGVSTFEINSGKPDENVYISDWDIIFTLTKKP